MTSSVHLPPVDTEALRPADLTVFEKKTFSDDSIEVCRVQIPDRYEHEPERQIIQAQLLDGEAYLREHPEVGFDSTENYPRQLIDQSAAFRAWREMMPSAMALYPLQRPEETVMPNGVEIDDLARLLFKHGPDSIGIRSRAEIMRQLILARANNRSSMKWMSLACGAAVPVLDAVRDLPPEIDAQLELVDYDDDALDFAENLAVQQGLVEGEDFQRRNRNLLKDLVFSDRLVQEFGAGSQDVVDMLGIFEYFPKERAAKMLTHAYELVAPNGSLIIGNMLNTHPTLEINRRAVNWPGITPRSIEEIAEILEDAGIPLSNAVAYVPQDEVYTVIEIVKPPELRLVKGELGAIATQAANTTA